MNHLVMRRNTSLIGCLLLAAVLVSLIPDSAHAQLSKRAIDSLREVGRQEGWTFEVGENDATQYTLEQLTGFKMPEVMPENIPVADFPAMTNVSLPAKFDWRTEVGLPPVRNQGGCGSCWAFATVGALECNIKIRDNKVVDLSEQYLVNCNTHNWGCGGGWWAHDMHKNRPDGCGGIGAVLEQYMPYYARDGACMCPYPHDYKVDDWGYVSAEWQTPSVTQLKQAIMLYGPVSVAVSVNDAFQGYRSGVFNGCSNGTINHAVVLVGWDDTQGPAGVWFMRNSWGTGWGEGGYMRLPYNCSKIGYNATWVKYRGSLWLTADQSLGKAPVDVTFAGGCATTATNWSWSFGDGGTANEQNPVHTYMVPGCYDVSVSAQTADGSLQSLYRECISVYADTAKLGQTEANGGQTAMLELSLNNYLAVRSVEVPISWDASLGLRLDSASTAGFRGDFIQTKQFRYLGESQASYQLVCGDLQPDLPPGNSPIVKLYFTVPTGAKGSLPVRIEPFANAFGEYNCQVLSNVGMYSPDVLHGAIRVCLPGDVNDNGMGPDLADLSTLIGYLLGLSPLPNPKAANVDGKSIVELPDLAMLIAYLVSGQPKLSCSQ